MRLVELQVNRLPGIDTPFTLTARPGVNLICGPNGSGKSSLCRAVRALLWPDTVRLSPCWIVATWEINGATWRAQCEGDGSVQWQRGGAPAGPPPLPTGSLADAFRLGVLDLLKHDVDEISKINAGDIDRRLAGEFATQMAGGYNLERVVRELFTPAPRLGQTERKGWTEAANNVRKTKRDHAALADDQDRLASLEQELAECRAADGRLRLWQRAREFAAVRARLAAANSEHESLPEVLAKVTGTESDELDVLAKRRAELTRDIEKLQRLVAEARQGLAAANLPDGPPPPDELRTQQERAAACREVEKELGHAQTELAEKRGQLESVRKELGPEWSDTVEAAKTTDPAHETTEPLGPETVRAAEAFLIKAAALRARREGLNRAGAQFQDVYPDAVLPDPDLADTGAALLGKWLNLAGPPPSRLPWFLTVTLVVALADAGLVAWRLGDWTPGLWLGCAVGAVGFGLLIWLLAGKGPRDPLRDQRAATVAEYAATGLLQPADWSAFAVEQQQRELKKSAEQSRRRAFTAERRVALAAEASELDEQETALSDERRKLAARIGISLAEAEASDADLVEFARRVHDHNKAVRAQAATAAKIDEYARQQGARLAQLNRYLEKLGLPGAGDGREAAVRITDLERRCTQYDKARAEIASHTAHLETLEKNRAGTEREERDLYGRLGLELNDRAGVARLEELCPRFNEISQLVQRLGREEQIKQDELEREPAFTRYPNVGTFDDEQLAGAIAKDRQRADEIADREREIQKIQLRVEQALAGAELQDALAAAGEARERLTDRCAEAEDAALGRLLLDDIKQEHETIASPPLLARARDLLTSFTHGRYDLHVAAEQSGSVFRVVDANSKLSLKLSQLSGGTRAQLFLAARLAYLLENEGGTCLPLWLDESLTASDPERFDAVARSLAVVARNDGRQVFYLTCDPADVAAWRRALAAATGSGTEGGAASSDADDEIAAPTTIDLGKLRRLAAAAPREQIEPPPPADAPPSQGMTAADYGRAIEAERFDPFAPASAVHLFHLLRDRLDLLEVLLRVRISSVGVWRRLADSVVRAATISTADARLLATRIELAEAFLRSWRVGRGRPVDREVIAASGHVSDTFREEVVRLCREVGGDGARLVEALHAGRVTNFRKDKAQALLESLEAGGHVDPRAVMTEDDLRTEVLYAVGHRLEAGDLDLAAADELLRTLWSAAGVVSSDSNTGDRGRA